MLKNNHINKICHTHNTKYNQNNVLILEMIKTTTHSYFLYVGPSILNNIPTVIKILNYKQFKLGLFNWLMQQATDYNPIMY